MSGAFARRYKHEMAANPALVEQALRALPGLQPVPEEPERIIRCSRANTDRAISRAIVRAAVHAELWRVEIVEGRQ